MADITNSQGFAALLAQTEAELHTRDLDVVPVAVRNVLAHAVDTVAEGMDIQPRSALRYIDPAVIADQIAEAGAESTEGAEQAHGIRPERMDDRTVPTERGVTGRPLMALTQAAKYATSNGDTRTAQHAIDLICEIGAAIADPDPAIAPIPAGVLDETVQVLERVAQKIEGGWSVCPCGEDHGQLRVDAAVPAVMRQDAGLVRTLRAGIDR
ncbi:hypothetical protein ACFPFX_12425 [Streptomyces mauvecolor]|uniref:DUF222 domain-containing protein n=1 Tax=Streptomyces mauvecolor TaxID=58345 RepID=A0ABV9UKX1_9ACTN